LQAATDVDVEAEMCGREGLQWAGQDHPLAERLDVRSSRWMP